MQAPAPSGRAFAMKGVWKYGLGLSLSLLVGQAWAEEIKWHPAPPRPAAAVQPVENLPLATPAATLGAPVVPATPAAPPPPAAAASRPAVSLDKPVPIAAAPKLVDPQVQPVSLSWPVATAPPLVARGAAPEILRPMPSGPPPLSDADTLK